jgi:hypothetical protein
MIDHQHISHIYWKVGDRSTYSKSQALIWAKGDISKISLYFFDNEWKDQKWYGHPTKSLETLIYERCLSLRNQSRHLCLWLSSGYDSVTVLNKFAKYHIPLDELCVISRRENDPEFPLARKIAQDFQHSYQPGVKITEIHLDYNYHGSIYAQLDQDFILLPGFGTRFTKSILPVMTHKSINALRLREDRSDRIDISGFDKPRLDLRDNRWYAMFPDTTIYDHAGSPLRGFWIDHDAFELYHAACWSVIDWFESLPKLDHDLVHRIQSNDPWYYPSWNLACGRDPVFNPYSHRSQGKYLFSHNVGSPDSIEFEKYWMRENVNIWNSYLSGVQLIQNLISEHWTDITTPLTSHKVTISSQSHYLRDLRVKSE